MLTFTLDRVLTAGILASLAVAVAFGPELGRLLGRLRNRRLANEVTSPISVEAQ